MIAAAVLFVVVLVWGFATRLRPQKTRVDLALYVATVVAIAAFILGCIVWIFGGSHSGP